VVPAGGWRIRRDREKEAVEAGVICVIPDDLAQIVNAVGLGEAGGRGIVEGGVNAAAKVEAVVVVRAHDLVRVVDAVRNGVSGGKGIEERGVSAEFWVEDEALQNRGWCWFCNFRRSGPYC